MAKKIYKLFFKDENGGTTRDWLTPRWMSVGDIYRAEMKQYGKTIDYEVVDKKKEKYKEGDEKIVKITYTLVEKKSDQTNVE